MALLAVLLLPGGAFALAWCMWRAFRAGELGSAVSREIPWRKVAVHVFWAVAVFAAASLVAAWALEKAFEPWLR